MISLVLDYFIWWYSAGFLRLLKYLKAFILILADMFSVQVLVTTFFQPWKRDITSTRGLSLDRRFQIWLFNSISRFFGMFIKGITFLVFFICFFNLLVCEIIIFFIWFFFPALVIAAIFWILKILSF
ncbi:MAG: hypothetical protein AB1465_03730 [Patescibacteria group bacterium]